MKTIKLLTLLAIFIGFSSCSDNDDDPVIFQIESDSETNLYAPFIGGRDQMGNVLPESGEFTKFNFSTGEITTSDTDWDIAFRGLKIAINGGVSSGITDEPARTGIGAAYLDANTLAGVEAVDTSMLEQDSVNGLVLTNWYDYNPVSHIITPTAGKMLVIKTHDGKYVKMEILSYYKDAPLPSEITQQSESRYFTFNYVYQPNEGVTTF